MQKFRYDTRTANPTVSPRSGRTFGQLHHYLAGSTADTQENEQSSALESPSCQCKPPRPARPRNGQRRAPAHTQHGSFAAGQRTCCFASLQDCCSWSLRQCCRPQYSLATRGLCPPGRACESGLHPARLWYRPGPRQPPPDHHS